MLPPNIRDGRAQERRASLNVNVESPLFKSSKDILGHTAEVGKRPLPGTKILGFVSHASNKLVVGSLGEPLIEEDMIQAPFGHDDIDAQGSQMAAGHAAKIMGRYPRDARRELVQGRVEG